VPTFVPFTPWTPLEGYEDLLTVIMKTCLPVIMKTCLPVIMKTCLPVIIRMETAGTRPARPTHLPAH
jgi:hypothetical protein